MADTTVTNIPDDAVYITPFGRVIARPGDKTVISDPATPPSVFKSVERTIGGQVHKIVYTIT